MQLYTRAALINVGNQRDLFFRLKALDLVAFFYCCEMIVTCFADLEHFGHKTPFSQFTLLVVISLDLDKQFSYARMGPSARIAFKHQSSGFAGKK